MGKPLSRFPPPPPPKKKSANHGTLQEAAQVRGDYATLEVTRTPIAKMIQN